MQLIMLLRRARNPIIAGFLLFLSLATWALSSPVGSSPDEDFHLASIWCGAGLREGLCEPGTDPASRKVPDAAVDRATCYALDPTESAACQGTEFLDGSYTLVESTRSNANGTYPPGYYLVTSIFASDNLVLSTLALRLFNSAFFSLLTVVTWCLLPKRFRFALAGSTALTFFPLGVFITASVNPSSWSLLSGALVIPATVGYFSSRGRQQIALGAVTVVAVGLSAATRGDAAVFAAFGLLVASFLSYKPGRRFLLAAGLPFILTVGCALVFFSAGQTSSAFDPNANPYAGDLTGMSLLLSNLLSLPNLWVGIWGVFWGLGWFDTGVPLLASIPLFFAFSGVLFTALQSLNWRKALATAALAAALVTVPLLLLQQNGAEIGEFVQPRYILPLATMLLAVTLIPAQDEVELPNAGNPLTATQLWIVATILTGANSISLFMNINRYVGAQSVILDANPEWWWSSGPSPLTLWVLGTLACAGFTLFLALGSLPRNTSFRQERSAIVLESSKEASSIQVPATTQGATSD